MSLPTRVQRNPDPAEQAQRDFDSMLGRFFGSRGYDGGNYLAPYGVNVREDADHIYVEAELPGYKKDEVDIHIENQTLTVSAEHKEQNEPKPGDKGEWLLRRGATTGFNAASPCRPPSIPNPFRPN